MELNAYLKQLPRKRTACGVLFVRGESVLIVKPTYKDGWSIPGGNVDANEPPLACAYRECREELGLKVRIDFLKVIDWMPEGEAGTGDSLQMIFMGHPLSADDEARIVLPTDELAEWRYAPFEEALELLSDHLSKRVAVALQGRDDRSVVLTANGV